MKRESGEIKGSKTIKMGIKKVVEERRKEKERQKEREEKKRKGKKENLRKMTEKG